MAIKSVYICDRCGKQYDNDYNVKIGRLSYSDIKFDLLYKDPSGKDLKTHIDFCATCARELIDWCKIKYDRLNIGPLPPDPLYEKYPMFKE